MHVTTSQYVISGKITFAQLKLNLPGHNLSANTTNNILHKVKVDTFTQLCENYTKQALLLWGLKQVFSSIMTGLKSKFDFEWTTTQTTVVSHRRRELFSSSASDWAQQSLYITRYLLCFYISCENLVINQLKFPECHFSANGTCISLRLGKVLVNENLWEIIASSTFLHCCSLALIMLGWLTSLGQMESLLACYLFCYTSTFLCWLIHVVVTKTITICRLLHTTSIRI